MAKPMEMSQPNEYSTRDNFTLSAPLETFDMKLNELVMQHFSGADFLKLSEVSKSFSAYVNNFQIDKIRLLIHETGERKLDMENLLASKREYKHIKITSLLYAYPLIPDLFQRFAHSLSSIYTAFDFDFQFQEGSQLPSVKNLTMVLSESPYFEHGLLSTVSSLKTLHLQGRTNFPLQLYKCLNNNNFLEELTLEKNAQDSFFANRRMPNFNLQLKSLKLDSSNFEDMARQNFERFLASLTTLKEIKVLKCSYQMLSKICNSSVFSVERVTFSPTESYRGPMFLETYDLKRNENITYMGLIVTSEALLQALLPNLPRLTTLYVSDPTPAMFKYIIANSPSLKEFRYAYFFEAYFSIELVRAIYEREASSGNEKVPKNLIITQI